MVEIHITTSKFVRSQPADFFNVKLQLLEEIINKIITLHLQAKVII